MHINNLAAATLLAAAALFSAAPQTPQEREGEIRRQLRQAPVFDFGKVRPEDPVEHVFQFRNTGTAVLEVRNVQITPPLTVVKMSRTVQPGETASIEVRMGQPRKRGDFEGLLVVNFTAQEAPTAFFRIQGRIVEGIDFDPGRAFYLTAFEGEPAGQELLITNYDSRPLKILKVESKSTRYNVELARIDDGRQYRLDLKTNPGAQPGKTTEIIRLFTSHEKYPVIEVPANVQVRGRVYSFPDTISFGLLDAAEIRSRPRELPFLTQVITVYQRKGTDFQIEASCDIPFVRVTKRQAQLKDRYELQLEVMPDKLRAGAASGFVRIATNDARFPLLEIPVTATVKSD